MFLVIMCGCTFFQKLDMYLTCQDWQEINIEIEYLVCGSYFWAPHLECANIVDSFTRGEDIPQTPTTKMALLIETTQQKQSKSGYR